MQNIESAKDDGIIVSAIMSMANSLKLKVVAESLETPQQLPFFLKYHWPNMADEIWANDIHSFYGTHFKRTDSLHSSM